MVLEMWLGMMDSCFSLFALPSLDSSLNISLYLTLLGGNILLDLTKRRLRIGDFGSSVCLDSDRTGPEEFTEYAGTVYFVAPEVRGGRCMERGLERKRVRGTKE